VRDIPETTDVAHSNKMKKINKQINGLLFPPLDVSLFVIGRRVNVTVSKCCLSRRSRVKLTRNADSRREPMHLAKLVDCVQILRQFNSAKCIRHPGQREWLTQVSDGRPTNVVRGELRHTCRPTTWSTGAGGRGAACSRKTRRMVKDKFCTQL
jgi:hypothetical protein